jgi:hypothetical protein
MITSAGVVTHIIGGSYYTGTDIPTMEGIPGQPLTAQVQATV